MDSVHKTKWHSWCAGGISEGCKLCVQGRKTVLFITGLCPQRCFYCPVGEEKFGKDVIFANEWQIKNPENPIELLEEVRLTSAKGAGITGGDPLAKVERCAQYIRLLKTEFGNEFHCHLYTPLALVTRERLKILADAGLDEIRFHPDMDDETLWQRIDIAKEFNWSIGTEIPAIPGYEEKTRKLIDFLRTRVSFLNLNELELSDTQISHYQLHKLGYQQKDDISYAVQGSKDAAVALAKYAQSKGLRAHFCTAKLKDAVQVKNRLLLRAKNVALPFDKRTSDGTLLRGAAYVEASSPGKPVQTIISSTTTTRLLTEALSEIQHIVPDAKLDEQRGRILLSPASARRHSSMIKKLGLLPAIVEEYPTSDALAVEVEWV